MPKKIAIFVPPDATVHIDRIDRATDELKQILHETSSATVKSFFKIADAIDWTSANGDESGAIYFMAEAPEAVTTALNRGRTVIVLTGAQAHQPIVLPRNARGIKAAAALA
ncbi:MAG: hypothetical protein HY433_02265 [Candidatus Liptonbacteria bacterium]|nr:hypothetical protein [Candidatus Liptonbacteria bacterium]